MIDCIRMRNFKCFDDASVPLNRVTVLAGLNGAGKSSLIQALLLLRQSGVRRDGTPGSLRLQGDLVDLGSFADVLYVGAREDAITVATTFQSADSVGVEVGRTDAGDQRLIDSTGFPGARKISLYRWAMYYLGPERLGPRKTLSLLDPPESGTPLGTNGEHIMWYLDRYDSNVVGDGRRFVGAPKDTLAAQATAWLGALSPEADLSVDPAPNADAELASFSFAQNDAPRTRSFRATSVWFGLSYALPVIVALLAAEEDDLVMIENPEAHLHPSGQTRLAELAARAGASGAQVVLETHSDHILDGIRLAVRDAIIEPGQTVLHYFQREDVAVRVETPVIRQDGRLDSWPNGFFDQHERNLAALIAPRSNVDPPDRRLAFDHRIHTCWRPSTDTASVCQTEGGR